MKQKGNAEDKGHIDHHIHYAVELYDDWVKGDDVYIVEEVDGTREIDEMQVAIMLIVVKITPMIMLLDMWVVIIRYMQ